MDEISTAEEGTLPKCAACGMQASETVRGLRHERSKTCHDMSAQRREHEAAATAVKALQRTFTAYGESLYRVEVFKYLGRLVSYDDVDTQEIRGNFKKYQKKWARISKVLRAEHASPRVCGMFYRATVQLIFLYGSESWTVAPADLAMMEGFHGHAARRMVGMMPRKRGDV